MKSICLIIRDGYDARFIIAELCRRNIAAHFTYIIESGKYARQKKVKRMLRDRNILIVVINIFALLIYDHIMLSRMKKICGTPDYPNEGDYINIDDVNELKCRTEIKNRKPDLILIYGSGILKAETIEDFGENIYNIHSSILPYYRNVHSDFWAYMDNRKDLIGVTIFKLDTGIDTGKIALQYGCMLPDNAKLYEYKAENLKNIPAMVDEFVADFFSGQLMLKPQNLQEGSIATTPRTGDIIQFFKREGMSGRY